MRRRACAPPLWIHKRLVDTIAVADPGLPRGVSGNPPRGRGRGGGGGGGVANIKFSKFPQDRM